MKKNQVKIGIVLSYIIIILNILINIGYTPILIRILGQSEYGLYSLVATVIAYITILDLGFGNAIIIYTARYRVNGKKEEENRLHGMFFIIYIIIGIIATVIGIILYNNIEQLFGKSMTLDEINKAKTLMLILTFNLGITFPFSIFNSIIIAYEKFIFSKIISIIRIISMPLFMIPLLLMGYRSISLVIVTTIINVAVLLINTIYCFKNLQVKLIYNKFNIKLLKEIWGYSFFIFLNIVIDKVNWGIDKFVLGSISGTVSVAIYSAASLLNQAFMSFSTAICGVLLPKVTKMEEECASEKQFTDFFIKTGRIQFLILALIITGFIVFGKQFIYYWIGNQYLEAYSIACILMISIIVPLIQNIGPSILQAKNLYRFMAVNFFGIAIFNVIISILLTKKYGGIGSAIGTGLALILGQGIILNFYYHKKVHIDIIAFWKEILKLAVPTIITFIIGLLMNEILDFSSVTIFIIKIIIYTIIYCILVWNFGMNCYEKNIVLSPIKKHIGKKNEYVDSK